ncbi:hypothetical protein EI94DRAFT_387204 [Lactarius quietus]|nr:hypothetical protein EI94DRAFT_387204 [Lactarius quietus]
MDTQHRRRRIPEIQFRVLILGRANAGKTSVLQRVCDTTKSTTIYRGNDEVTLDPSVNVSGDSASFRLPLNMGASEASTTSTTSLCSPI